MRRFSADSLREFSLKVLVANGLEHRHASVTAEMLVEADLLGHRTHGVDLLPIYAGFLMEGKLLPGQSLIVRAIETAVERAEKHGVVSVAIARSQHTGCHAAYLGAAVERGYLVLITAASSYGQRIAPIGGLEAVFSPSPFAVGIPTEGEPILVDLTMASAANSVCRQHYQRKERLPHRWLLDSSGGATDDPTVLYEEPLGTILPLGGVDNGHKGIGLMLMVEALSLGLTGKPHVFEPEASSQSVYLQVIDPDAFAGKAAFEKAMSSIVDASRASRPAPGVSRPRMPGESALEAKRQQLQEGVEVAPDVLERLAVTAEAAGVEFPAETLATNHS